MRLAHRGRVWVRAAAFRRVAEIAAGVLRLLEWHLPRIALAESASASFVSRYAASADSARQGHIEHDWRVCWPMKDRYAGDPPLCAKRVRRSTALMAARPRRRGYFPLPRTAADICVRTVRKGPDFK